MRGSVEDRFWAKVGRKGADDCWPWTAGKDAYGYGTFSAWGKIRKAHRVALVLTGVDVPDDLCVLHSCHARDCVNPAHLRVGTVQDNVDDMMAVGNHVPNRQSGEEHSQVKLTEGQVRIIRQWYAYPWMSQQKIATAFKISQTQVGRIVRGERWATMKEAT